MDFTKTRIDGADSLYYDVIESTCNLVACSAFLFGMEVLTTA